jgi:hypothetical protein
MGSLLALGRRSCSVAACGVHGLQSLFPLGPRTLTLCSGADVTRLSDLAREYEARRFPRTNRLDLHGEGPETARERALRWIQSQAHEQPGAELLLVVERGGRPGRAPGPVRRAVEQLLVRLTGGLIDWWQPFGTGSLALRLSDEPRLVPFREPTAPDPRDEGRTPETAGAVTIEVAADIPPELLPLARRAAELRRAREGGPVAAAELLLARLWLEAQARAMDERLSFEGALERILAEEERLAVEEW